MLQRYIDHPGVAGMPQNHPSLDDRVRCMRSGKARTKDLAWGGVREDSEQAPHLDLSHTVTYHRDI